MRALKMLMRNIIEKTTKQYYDLLQIG